MRKKINKLQREQQTRGRPRRRRGPLRQRRMARRNSEEHMQRRHDHFLLAVWFGYRDVFDFIFPHPMDLVLWADDALEMILIKIPIFVIYLPIYYVLLAILAVIGLPISFVVTTFLFMLRR